MSAIFRKRYLNWLPTVTMVVGMSVMLGGATAVFCAAVFVLSALLSACGAHRMILHRGLSAIAMACLSLTHIEPLSGDQPVGHHEVLYGGSVLWLLMAASTVGAVATAVIVVRPASAGIDHVPARRLLAHRVEAALGILALVIMIV